MVIARTAEGDIGVLRGPHAAALGADRAASSRSTAPRTGTLVAAVDGGFLSVANNRVSILCEHAEMSHEIDLDEARAELEAAEADPTTTRRRSGHALPRPASGRREGR